MPPGASRDCLNKGGNSFVTMTAVGGIVSSRSSHLSRIFYSKAQLAKSLFAPILFITQKTKKLPVHIGVVYTITSSLLCHDYEETMEPLEFQQTNVVELRRIPHKGIVELST